MKAIDLFAGLGGMGLGARLTFEVVAAFDQDEAAAAAHEANHAARVVRRDVSSVRAEELAPWQGHAWLASPPCQPFTRRGRRRDVEDPRCAALLNLIRLLPACRPPRVLVENVVGFHGSRAHALLVDALRRLGHEIADISACPSEEGWPVRRPRQFTASSSEGLRPLAPPVRTPRALADFLDGDPAPGLAIGAAERERVEDHFPMAGRDGVLGTFTRSYGRAVAGAGPVHWTAAGPRRFSPEEILRLHAFPRAFAFPEAHGLRTRWRLAGNVAHVAAVARVVSVFGRG